MLYILHALMNNLMKKYYLLLIPLVFFACQSNSNKTNNKQEQYPDYLGEIQLDSDVDDPNFTLCDTTKLVQSRLALSYEGGFAQLEEMAQAALIRKEIYKAYSGYVMVRFLINCQKETGRFRFQTLDEQFLVQDCPQELKEEIQNFIKGLDQWVFLRAENQEKDHSKYLNFKFEQGQLISIIH